MTGDDGIELSKEEAKAIRRLRKLAKEWPETLWLYSNGSMYVMRKKPGEGQIMRDGGRSEGVDPAHTVETIVGLYSEGGDW